MLPLPIVTLPWVSTEWAQKHSRMNLPAGTENQRTRISDIFMVVFSEDEQRIDRVCLFRKQLCGISWWQSNTSKSNRCTRATNEERLFFLFEGLSRIRDGLLVAECDLNLCRQMKDKWGFRMTQRLDLYADSFARVIRPDYKMDIIKDSSPDN